MVVIQENPRDWVAFDPSNSNNFPGGNQKSGITTPTGRSRKVPLPSRSAQWMQEPIRTDDSWIPVAAPDVTANAGGAPESLPPTPLAVGAPNVGMSAPVGIPTVLGSPGAVRPMSPVILQERSPRPTRDNNGSRRNLVPDVASPKLPKQDSIRRTNSVGSTGSMKRQHMHQMQLHTQYSADRGKDRVRANSRERSSRPPPTRGRSNSRSRQKAEQRERSLSQSRSVASHSSQNSRSRSANRGRSRPPVTRNGRDLSRGRSRSAPRERARARSRSASLTRITNGTQQPPQSQPPSSPVVRNIKTIASGARPPAAPNLAGHGHHHNGGGRQEQPPRSTRNGSQRGPRTFDDDSMDANIGRDITFGNPKSNSSVSSSDSRKKVGIMGKLFGDGAKKQEARCGMGEQIRPRVLLAATVYHNTATNLWITTINTNQRGVARDPTLANKYLKAFSFPSEQEARESAIANAPPKMIPFNECPQCFVCKSAFAVFRRASHCRNCGVCICKDCSVQWSARVIPDTYNLKNEAIVKVCRSCNNLSKGFRKALMEGDFEEAVAIYSTGNINLRTPFPVFSKKDEMMFPVHCAVEGGNINILRWLIDDHFCPIKMVRSGSKKPRRGAPESLIPTSKGRNVLSIAIERLKVEMMQYLVVDCGVSIYESTDFECSLRALEATLISLPKPSDNHRGVTEEQVEPRWDDGSFDDISVPSSIAMDIEEAEKTMDESTNSIGQSSKNKSSDFCIICFDRKIDCVSTPCGHQITCLECSANLTACPVCNNKGEFIKIFRP